MKELDDEVRKVKLSKHLQVQYASSYIHDLETFEKGVEQERAKAEKEKLEIAKKALKEGISAEVVGQITGIDLAVISKLELELEDGN